MNNLSNLNIIAGSTAYGYVAYYAALVGKDINANLLVIDGVEYIKTDTEQIVTSLIDTSLKEIILDAATTNVGANAFRDVGVNIETVVINEGCTVINASAFNYCYNLKEVTLPSTLKIIGEMSFERCIRMETIYNNSSLNLQIGSTAYGGVARYVAVINPDENTRFYTSGGLRYVINGNEKVVLGVDESVNPSSASVENGTTRIKAGAFYENSKLSSLTSVNTIYDIGESAFELATKITDLDISECLNISIIRDNLFYNSGLKTISLPSGIITIEDFGLASKNLVSVNLEDLTSLEKIDDYGFYYAEKLESITIPGSVKNIEPRVFEKCGALVSVNVEQNSNLTTLKASTFAQCTSLRNINIENFANLTAIESDVFSGCSSLESIKIASSVTSIGSGVFTGCTSLATVTVDSSVIASKLTSATGASSLINNATTIYLKQGITASTYVVSNYSLYSNPETEGYKAGYNMYKKN